MRCERLAVITFAAAASLVAQASIAADLPAVVKAAPVSTVQDWSGFYAGGNIGRGWARTVRWENIDNTTLFGDNQPPDTFRHGASGTVGGGQLGLNFQTGAFVFGVEALYDGSNIEAKHSSTAGAADDQFAARIKSVLLLTGRVGYAWHSVLGYLKGGYAGVNFRASVSDDVPPSTGSGDDRQWRSGWTLGAGFEYAVTSNLSLALEYNHIRVGEERHQLGGGSGSYQWDVDARDIEPGDGEAQRPVRVVAVTHP